MLITCEVCAVTQVVLCEAWSVCACFLFTCTAPATAKQFCVRCVFLTSNAITLHYLLHVLVVSNEINLHYLLQVLVVNLFAEIKINKGHFKGYGAIVRQKVRETKRWHSCEAFYGRIE